MIRIILPPQLREMAGVDYEVHLEAPATIGATLDALEARYPVLRGTIRDQHTLARRPLIRFYGCREDLSHQPQDTPLPAPVAAGTEPLFIIGAIAGG